MQETLIQRMIIWRIHMKRYPQGLKPGKDFFNVLLIVFCIVPLFLFSACTTVHKPEAKESMVSPQRLVNIVKECESEYNDVPWLSTEDFHARDDAEEWVIIDVRSEAEREISVIPDAVSIGEFEAAIGLYRERSILVYCTVGCRSGAYVRTLQAQGFSAFNLWGGVLDWAGSGREFISPDGLPVRSVHVFGEKWNILPPGYEGIW